MDSILLKQRWPLIQSGTDCHAIRIRGPRLYYKSRLYVQVIDSKFVTHSGRSDYFPHPLNTLLITQLSHPTLLVSLSVMPFNSVPVANANPIEAFVNATEAALIAPIIPDNIPTRPDTTPIATTSTSSPKVMLDQSVSNQWLPHRNPLSCCRWNCHSIMNKLSQFQLFAYSISLDIIALSETWLSNNILNREILPANYTSYCSDCESGGGGAMLCISSNSPLAFCNLLPPLT